MKQLPSKLRSHKEVLENPDRISKLEYKMNVQRHSNLSYINNNSSFGYNIIKSSWEGS